MIPGVKKTWLVILFVLAAIYPAMTQPVQQSGYVTPTHVPMWTTNGIIQDGGTATNGFLTSIGVTASGPAICQNSAPVTSGAYQQICLGAVTGTGATISLQNYGSAPAGTLNASINGTIYPFPFTTGGVVGPSSSTVGDIAVWNNSAGTLLKDVAPTAIFGTENANTVFAGPSSGSAADPTFRGVVSADLTTALTTPPAVGGTTPAAGAFTTLGATGNTDFAGTSNAVGTITSGTWEGSAIGLAYGGLGGSQNAATAHEVPVFPGSSGAAVPTALSSLMDTVFGSTQGDILYRGSSSWAALSPGTSGYYLQTQGASANPQWAAVSVGLPANVSGSNENTTATCTASSASVAIAAAEDFVNGEGISLEHCGTTFSGSAPTSLAVSATGANGQGPTGSTHYSYQVSCVDNFGGVGAAVAAVTITNGYATLGTITQSSREIAYNKVTWSTSCAGVAVWREIASGGYVLLGVFGQGIAGGTLNEVDDTGLPTVTIPWIPSTPPASALNDRFVSTISSGGGTTSLTLAATVTNNGSTEYTRHDDTAALNTYYGAVIAAVLPAGTYNVEGTTLPTTLASLTGAGQAATNFVNWSGSTTGIIATSMPTSFKISGLSIFSQANAAGLFASSDTGCVISNTVLSGITPLILSSNTECTVTNNFFPTWYVGYIADVSGSGNNIISNIAPAGNEINQAVGIYTSGTDYDVITANASYGGEYFGILVLNGSNNQVQGNKVANSLREGLHLSGNANNNMFTNNMLIFNSSSIDFGISDSDDGASSTSQAGNVISGNYIYDAGISCIALAEDGGSSNTYVYTPIKSNTCVNSNADAISNTPEVFLNGSEFNDTIIDSNTFLSGSARIEWLVEESNVTYGYPTNTEVGAQYGLGNTGSGDHYSLGGSGSSAITGGTTGLDTP